MRAVESEEGHEDDTWVSEISGFLTRLEEKW